MNLIKFNGNFDISNIGAYSDQYGGYFAGVINTIETLSDQTQTGLHYAIFLAPKRYGEIDIEFSTISVTGYTSSWDGEYNNNLLNKASAVKWCNDLNINGFRDWYIPAIDELELIYRYFKPTSDLNNFLFDAKRPHNRSIGFNPSSIPRGLDYSSDFPYQCTTPLNRELFLINNQEFLDISFFHWSSSIYTNDYLYGQHMGNGTQYGGLHRSNYGMVRAIRRHVIARPAPPIESV